MKKYTWVAYGLDMFGYVVIETEGNDIIEAHEKAVGLYNENKMEFDTVEPFDVSFLERVKLLNCN